MVAFLPTGEPVAQRLDRELGNLRASIAWLEHIHDADRLLRLCGSLLQFLSLRGHLREGHGWLERAVSLGRAANAPALATGLVALASAVHLRGDEPRALALVDEGVKLARATGDGISEVMGLMGSGLIALRLNELERAAAFQEEALAVLPGLGGAIWFPLFESTILGHLGNIAIAGGNIDRADIMFAAALDRQRALGYEPGSSHAYASHPLAGLGDVARARGDRAQALTWYRGALAHAWRFRDTRAVAYALGGIASSLAVAGAWGEAARFFGVTEALHERAGLHFALETMNRQRALGLPEPWQRASEPFGSGQPLRDALGARPDIAIPVVPDLEAAARAWAAGRELPLAQATAEAMTLTIPDVPAAPSAVKLGLTPREAEVLRLMAQGRPNREIADLLFISVPTVKRHLTTIYTKLGVSSRAAATAYAHTHLLV